MPRRTTGRNTGASRESDRRKGVLAMIDKTFVRTGLDGSWVECTDERIAHEELEQLNCMFIVRHPPKLYESKWVLCYFHRIIDGWHYLSIRSEEEENRYCTELKQQGEIVAYYEEKKPYEEYSSLPIEGICPVRWHVFQKNAESALHLDVDVCFLNVCARGGIVRFERLWIDISMKKNIVMVSQQPSERWEKGPWTENPNIGIEIPKNIFDTVLQALIESTKARYGIRPTPTWAWNGIQAILTFARHPFDWNIGPLRHFIGEDIFDNMFPREQKDNFPILCNYLSIQPNETLHEAYRKNPYAIVWHMILREFGVTEVETLARFYGFTTDVIGIPITKVVYRDAHTKMIFDDSWRDDDYRLPWKSVCYYIRWLASKRSVNAAAEAFFQLAKNGLSENQYHTIWLFIEYEFALPESILEQFLDEGLTEEIHSLLEQEVEKLPPSTRDYWLTGYVACAHGYRIGDYEFRWLNQTALLPQIEEDLGNGATSCRNDILAGCYAVLLGKKRGKYVIWVTQDRNILRPMKVSGIHHESLHGDDLLAFQRWETICCPWEMWDDPSLRQAEAKTEDWPVSTLPCNQQDIGASHLFQLDAKRDHWRNPRRQRRTEKDSETSWGGITQEEIDRLLSPLSNAPLEEQNDTEKSSDEDGITQEEIDQLLHG